MKVVILVRILWASGAQKIAIEEARYLSSAGHDVKLVFLREGSSGKYLIDSMKGLEWEIFSTAKPNPVYSYVTGLFMPDRGGEGTLDYDLLKSYAASLSRRDADLIVCHDQWAGIAGLKIKKRLGIPFMVLCHERVSGEYRVPVLGRLARSTEQKVLENADKVFGITDKVAASIKDTYGIEAIPDYPGMNRQSSIAFGERENAILASATWDANRDPSLYARIVQRLPGFKLYVVGRFRTAKQREGFMKFAESEAISKNVIILNAIGEKDLQDLYGRVKFNIRFGKDEWGPGLSNIEAISHLTPIIVNSELGIADVITRMGGGFVVPEHDPAGINPDHVAHLIKEADKEERYNVLQDQLRFIGKEYNWKSHSESLISLVR